MSATATEPTATSRDQTWHGLTAEEAYTRLGVDPRAGLDLAEVEQRRAEHGPNRLAEQAKEPGWHAFLRQYRDLMQLVLVGAAVVSVVALQEFGTGLAILGITVVNAILGLNQEGKAAESIAALQKMLVIKAHARRGGQAVDIASEELVPGDIVSFEAGDKIPADGRLLVAATLEIEEAALTGESVPVLKSIDPVPGDDVPLGDRLDMAYMNSTVTRGRGEMVVTATGMETEVGHISGMLSQVQEEKTPLTRQLDQLTVLLTIMASAALVLVVILGLISGESFDDLFLIGISLAIAAIPTGLPAVVTTVLSLGTQALAAKGAIVKRLRSVETLGATSAICSDKTGTLTLNQMTARQLVVAGRRYLGRRRGLLDHREDPPDLGRVRHAARAVPDADGARQRRRGPRRRDRRRPDRGGPRRARREGRDRRRRDAAAVSARRRGAVRLGVQVHGDVPRARGGRAQGRALLRQGSSGRPARALVADPKPGGVDRSGGRRHGARDGRERPARERRAARAGGRLEGLRPGLVRRGRRPPRAGART